VSDLDQVLRLWQQIDASGEDCVLATIVRVEGSSYRKPGARMLVTKGGLRAGTISGGCLEAEVSKQAWWLTEQGPTVRAYSTSFEAEGEAEGESGGRPYGLGCGGTVHLLLERRDTAEFLLRELQRAFAARQPLSCAVVLEGAEIGSRCVMNSGGEFNPTGDKRLSHLAQEAWLSCESFIVESDGESPAQDDTVWAEYIPPRCGLFIFGAGDDAKPLVTQASTLGWHITVADGRAHLATRARFSLADEVAVLRNGDVSALNLLESDAAVIMTHSYEQDRNILKGLLARELAYIGVLGPRYRTADLLRDVATELGGTPRRWMKKLHAPVGLNLGGDSPATIALAILAQIQGIVGLRQTQTAVRAKAEQCRPDTILS
jgi:xanthine dehydrogenase accessory factor